MDIIHSDTSMGITTNTHMGNDGSVAVTRHQDVSGIIDAIHAEHMETGGNVVEGVGRHLGDLPLTVLMHYCGLRGIRWEAVAYTNDHNDVLKDCLKEYQKFCVTGGKYL